ncbi:lycopene cyclase family protein [Ilumatobacter sp.]|uniref:lycopene cyclase family protein n=1 Tax=Ilumatobacter sp. TaxID=1967498 RepID=UPI003C631DB0
MSARDVGVVGDGPAGSALARSLERRGVDVVLIGADRPWTATYTTWIDDLDGVDGIGAGAGGIDDQDVWLHRFDSIAAHFERSLTIPRGYGVLDNERLHAVLRDGVRHEVRDVTAVADVDARLVVDATGWPSGLGPADLGDADVGDVGNVSWQTAFGVVLPEPPSNSLGVPTMMDFSDPPSAGGSLRPTFAYALPVADGWLVEETVLAGPAIDPDALSGRLASRLGLTVDDMLARADRIERVRIPMGAPIPGHDPVTARFGAAAGMIHTATGYSVAASLRAADRVADAIVERLDVTRKPNDARADAEAVAAAVWPTALRRSRRLHDYGLDVLLAMDVDEIRRFFETFFSLPREQWAAYLRIDTPPRDLARVMSTMFRRADWGLRRRLVSRNPRLLFGVLRP